MYLYRAIDSNGDTVEFWFSERRNLTAAKRFLRKALKRHGRPERIVIDGSQTNREAILSCDTETGCRTDQARAQADPDPAESIPQQSHRAGSPRHQAPGPTDARLQVDDSARVILGGIEMVHMMRKRTGEVCLQSAAVACRAVSPARRMRRHDTSAAFSPLFRICDRAVFGL